MISWIGGKSQISKWICPFIPVDIKTYVEPFGGAFWCYLKMDLSKFENLDNVVYNDFNNYLVNLFMSCKEHEKFYTYLSEFKSQNRLLFEQYQKDLFDSESNFELNMPNFEYAMKFAYLATQVWSGISPSTGKFIDLKGKYKSKFDTFRDKLIKPEYISKLSKITNFENLDFEKVIEKYDGDDSFFYIDAPYHNTEHYYSNHDFKKEDHERLAKCLKSIKGKFAMSYYEFKELSDWFPKNKYRWESKDFSKSAMARSGKDQTKGTELLIMNY